MISCTTFLYNKINETVQKLQFKKKTALKKEIAPPQTLEIHDYPFIDHFINHTSTTREQSANTLNVQINEIRVFAEEIKKNAEFFQQIEHRGGGFLPEVARTEEEVVIGEVI